MDHGSPAGTAPRILGAAPVGVTKKVTAEIVRNLKKQLAQGGRFVTVKAIRFIPSSRTVTESGSFQVVANAVVDVAPGRAAPSRPAAFDSVVTVGRSGRVQKLEALTIPSLRSAAMFV